MYKVFYNEKSLILSDVPTENTKSLKFTDERQFDEALELLGQTTVSAVNLYAPDSEQLLKRLAAHLDYLEAAGGVVQNPNKDFLMIYRFGKWDLPKGKVENGETTESAAIREVIEECGIDQLKSTGLIAVTYHIYFQNSLKLKAVYWYQMLTESTQIPVPQNEEGIESAEWKSKEELPELLKNTYENIRTVFDEFFAANPLG